MFKGILAGKSKAVFSGKVLVKQDAQKTRAFQKDLNFYFLKIVKLTLSPAWRFMLMMLNVVMELQLVIWIKNMLFYLQSRELTQR